MLTKIGIYKVTFDLHVGVTEEERSVPQTISVDLELIGEINTQSDNLDETIDYDTICRKMIAVCREAPVLLIETLAEKIAQMALSTPRVDSVLVRVKKEHPPLKEILGGFVVEIQRKKQ